MSDEIKTVEVEKKEEPKKAVPKKVDLRKFINRGLTCANSMQNKRKAEEIAQRFLRNK